MAQVEPGGPLPPEIASKQNTLTKENTQPTTHLPACPASLASHNAEQNIRVGRKRPTEQPDGCQVSTKSSKYSSRSDHSRDSAAEDTSFTQLLQGHLLSSDPQDEFILNSRFKVKNIGEWSGLAKLAYIGDKIEQEPFAEIDALMIKVQDFGSLQVQTTFSRAVCAWMALKTASESVGEASAYLDKSALNGDDSIFFRPSWTVAQECQGRRGDRRDEPS